VPRASADIPTPWHARIPQRWADRAQERVSALIDTCDLASAPPCEPRAEWFSVVVRLAKDIGEVLEGLVRVEGGSFASLR